MQVTFGEALPPIDIVGEQLVLRPFEYRDLPLLEEASADEVIPSGTTVPSRYTPHEGRAFIDRQTSRLATGTGWSFAIAVGDPHSSRSPDRAVGQIGLWIAHLDKGRCEIGYWVAASQRGQGITAEAVRMLSGWAFDNLPQLHRLSLFIEPWNTASIRTAERAGYAREAVLRHWQTIGGEPKDMWSYARTRSDHLVAIAPSAD